MCHEEHHRGRGFAGARGFRGFGRGGFPNREEWVERLESDLANVRDLIARLKDEPEPSPSNG